VSRVEPLDPVEQATWRSFLAWSSDVLAAVENRLVRAGMSTADYRVLRRLADADGTLSQSVLQADLDWSASHLSHQLRRMAERGLLDRRSTGHGREMSIVWTHQGRRALGDVEHLHADAVRAALLTDLPQDIRDYLLSR
jgi:DNA-binding MarR family transcriptional regulator